MTSMEPVVNELQLHALRIWRAGVAAVHTGTLIRRAVRREDETLLVGPLRFDLRAIGRIAVVGGGKAAAPMAEALEDILGEKFVNSGRLVGWVNVPETQVRPLQAIRLHAARPLGVNEPTEQAAFGTAQILAIVSDLRPEDLCLVLITGGASALLPAPIPPLTIQDKVEVTRALSAAGATIEQLNTVRKHLSRIKGGRLAAACRAGWLIALIVSDVLGDRLEVIGSGPTVPDPTTPADALRVLDELGLGPGTIPEVVFRVLDENRHATVPTPSCRVENLIIGNLDTAVCAAGETATHLGYRVKTAVARSPEPTAEEVASQLVAELESMQQLPDKMCLVSGGEPVVRLVEPARRGRGGRNQQLVLAALGELLRRLRLGQSFPKPFVILAGGTDGEDGPTDAAGAWIDHSMAEAVLRSGVDVTNYLERNDAYTFFEEWGTLIKTGPTDTNVGDLRVVLVGERPT